MAKGTNFRCTLPLFKCKCAIPWEVIDSPVAVMRTENHKEYLSYKAAAEMRLLAKGKNYHVWHFKMLVCDTVRVHRLHSDVILTKPRIAARVSVKKVK